MKTIGLNKKSLLYFGVILIIALIVFIGIFFYFSNKNNAQKIKNPQATPQKEDIIKSLSIPASSPAKISESTQKKIQKSLSIPVGNKIQTKISENDILKSLNVPK